jgi:hypothetical protein
MRSHRTIISIGGIAVALAVALPAPALAKSLLSGYGAPGEGNQAILGSALLNGPRGGGGSGSGSANPSGSSSATGAGGSSNAPGEATSGESAPSGSGGSEGGRSETGGGSTRHSARKAGQKAGRHAQPQAPARAADFYPVSERVVTGAHSGALGLSGAEVIYMVLVVGVLVFMGVTTRRLSRITRPEDTGS